MSKFIKCKKCGKCYYSSSKVCPQCFSKTPFQTTNLIVGIVGGFIGLCVIAFILSAILGTDNTVQTNGVTSEETSNIDSNTPSTTKTTESHSSKNNEISINKITIVDDFECKIKEVNWYSSSDFDFDVIEREKGFEYLVVVLSEKNTTDSTQNAPMISILSADGKDCINLTALSLYKKKYKINFGATLPNSTAEAYVIYKVPSGANSFMLQILSDGFGKNSDYITFSRADIK